MAQEADQRWLNRHLTHDVECLHNRPAGVIYGGNTVVRHFGDDYPPATRAGESCAEMLPAAVLDYIREQGLYC